MSQIFFDALHEGVRELCFISLKGRVSSLPTHHEATTQPYRLEVRANVRELSLLQFRLPEDRVCIHEAMLDPALLFHVVKVYRATGVRILKAGPSVFIHRARYR
jgi:hypothetical protein